MGTSTAGHCLSDTSKQTLIAEIPVQSISPFPSPVLVFHRWKEAILFSQLLLLLFDSPLGISFFQDYSSSNVSFGKRKINWSVPGNPSSALCKEERRGAVALVCRTLDWGVTGRRGSGCAKINVFRYKAVP